MSVYRPDNIPLPNLSLARKLVCSVVLLVGLGIFLGTWAFALHGIYDAGNSGSLLGIGLAMLAGDNWEGFFRLCLYHGVGMTLILISSFFLFRRTSLRRRVKWLIVAAAVFFSLLDIFVWLRAPECTTTNRYVGYLGAVSALALFTLAVTPLYQMWVYPRWRPEDGKIKRVVIVGGGFAGLYAALGLNRKLGYNRNLEIKLLDRRNYFLFPPLLPSAAAGTIETRQVSYPFRRIFETTNIIFRKVDVTAIDPQAKVVRGIVNTSLMSGQQSAGQAEFPYDYLVLAPGSVSQTFGTKGAVEHSFFMRELNDAIKLRDQVIDCFEQAAVLASKEEQRCLLQFVIVGAGPTGVETATEIHDLIHGVLLKRYQEIDPSLPCVTIVQSGSEILPGWPAGLVQTARKQLERMKVKVLLSSRVSEVGADFIRVGEQELKSKTIVWCAGVKASPLLALSGLPLHAGGRIPVGADLSVAEHPEVFVLGDSALCQDPASGQPLPPLGQVAFQQGSHTAKNLLRKLRGQSTRPFAYFNFGGLVSVGEHFAAVDLMGVKLSGFVGWVVWRSLYLAKIVGMSNRIRVMVDWTLDLLIERSISQIRDESGAKS